MQKWSFSNSNIFQDSSQLQLDCKTTFQGNDDALKSDIKQEETTCDSSVVYHPNNNCETFNRIIPRDLKQQYKNVDTPSCIKTKGTYPLESSDEVEVKIDDRLEPELAFKDENKYQDTELILNEQDGADIMKHCDYSTEPRPDLINPTKLTHAYSAEELTSDHSDHSTRVRSSLNPNTKVKYDLSNTVNFKQDDETAEMFKCSRCDFTTKYQICLTQHVSSNHTDGTNVYKCNRCDFVAKWQHILKTHVTLDHDDTEKKVFECSQCYYSCRRRGNLVRHLKIAHDIDAEIFKCNQCDYATEIKAHLVKHIRWRHNDNAELLKCHKCDFSSRNKAALMSHVRYKHDFEAKGFECHQCDFSTIHESYFKSHVRYKHDLGAEVFKCNRCNYATYAKRYLIQHFRCRHDDSAEVFRCRQCNFSTRTKATLRSHSNYKHNVDAEVFECCQCDYSTKVKSSLTRHVKLRHGDTIEAFKCDGCGFSSRSRAALKSHLRYKHNV